MICIITNLLCNISIYVLSLGAYKRCRTQAKIHQDAGPLIDIELGFAFKVICSIFLL